MIKKVLCVITLAVILLVSSFVLLINHQINQQLTLDQAEFITIDKGVSVSSFSHQLVKNEWLTTKFWLRNYVRIHPQYAKLKSGTYLVEPNTSMLELLTLLVSGKEHQFTVTFIEGTTFKQWLALLSKKPHIQQTLNNNSVEQISAMLNIEMDNPEGWFYPDTYAYTDKTKDITILMRAYNQMKQKLRKFWNERDLNIPYDKPYQALIMASIIEKESGKIEEQALISSVFTNRLHKKMRLQTDPTIIYGLGDRYKGDIKTAHKYEKTAYNTYRINGLPPTPIAMPGGTALYAVMHPVSSDYLYFVGKGDGYHHFSSNLKEHNTAVNLYQRKRKKALR
ncbi:MAG: endolytic transglycosylase MltG [Alteromonadaceae bacterium]|nr:endolytic transglycosylase MltG [Alteromonadaceae bacterium]